MTDMPDVKMRGLVNFPVSVTGRTGINVVKVNGRYYVDLDVSGFVRNANIPTGQVADKWVTVWDATANSYQNIPYSLVATAGVASIHGHTGALDTGHGLIFTGDTLEVARDTFDTLAALAAEVVDSQINSVRLAGALAAGDDGDAILVRIATPAIIKPWHKPSNGAWWELMSTVGRLRFFGGKASGSTANNSANNQALKDAAQWLTERKEAGCSTEIEIHPGVYDYDDSDFNFAQHGASLLSRGNPILRYHGSANGLVLDGGTDLPHGLPGIYGFHMLGELTVQSNTAADDAILLRGALDSDLHLRCAGGNATKAGLRIEFGVCSRIRYSCSSNYRPPGAVTNWWSGGTAPLYGLYADAVAGQAGTPVSACTLYPVVEGVARGVFLNSAGGMQIMHGTVEGCSISGLTVYVGSSCNVYGTDFEANGIDVECLGTDSNFFGISCGGNFSFGTTGGAAAARNRILGGSVNKISLDTGTHHNQVLTDFNTDGTGFLHDSGDHNMTKGSLDVANQAFYFRGPTGLTVGASPYSFTNTFGDTVAVSVAGGTVSAISIDPQGGGSFISTGSTAGIFTLAPKGVLKVTYSVAPAMSFWGI